MLMLLLGLVSPFLETQLSRWCVASTLLPAFYLGLLVCEQELDVDYKVFAASDLRSAFETSVRPITLVGYCIGTAALRFKLLGTQFVISASNNAAFWASVILSATFKEKV